MVPSIIDQNNALSLHLLVKRLKTKLILDIVCKSGLCQLIAYGVIPIRNNPNKVHIFLKFIVWTIFCDEKSGRGVCVVAVATRKHGYKIRKTENKLSPTRRRQRKLLLVQQLQVETSRRNFISTFKFLITILNIILLQVTFCSYLCILSGWTL